MYFKGVVYKHKGNGRKFGYPTANIEVAHDAEEGVFVGWTVIKNWELGIGNWKFGQKLPSMIFIGTPETLRETNKRLETYILDFPDKDLYGQHIKVETLRKLRDNKKFGSVEDLIVQMKKDEIQVREYFKKLNVS